MKKILSILGVVSFLTTGAGSIMSSSCGINTSPPDFRKDISKFVVNKDLGEISGMGDLPTRNIIFNKIIEKNPDCDFSVERLERTLVNKNISTSIAEFSLSDFGLGSWYGSLTVEYKYKKNENSYLQTNFKESGNGDELIDHFGTINEVNNFTNKVSNFNFFTLLREEYNLGYTTTTDGRGLCEYISLTSLINYFHLHRNYDYYTNEEIKKYYDYFNPDIVDHKNFGNKNTEAVPYKMWEKNDKRTDLKSGKWMRTAISKWIENKDIKITDDYSAAWWHTSQPEKWLIDYDVPVLLSFYKNGLGHNVLIYAYDEKTDSYAVNFGWPGRGYCISIIKKKTLWSTFSVGFWYAFREI